MLTLARCCSYENPEAGVGQFLNTGLTTTINFGSPVLEAVSHLVTSHEMGHNWGSSHDGSPPDAACTPSGSSISVLACLFCAAVPFGTVV